MNIIRKEAALAGRQLILETGRLASLADASVMCQYGGTQVLATFTVSGSVRQGIDYLPLMVDYEERLYAAGKIKGSRFIKREGRPTDEAILSGRLIDRALRPLFNPQIRNDIQIVATVLSVDKDNDPDIVALVAASAALALSGIKLVSPLVAAVRVAKVEDGLVVNPTAKQTEKLSLDLVLAASKDKINMIEAGGQEVPEAELVKALVLGQQQIKKLLSFINSFIKSAGERKFVKELILEKREITASLKEQVEKFAVSRLDQALFVEDKKERLNSLRVLEETLSDSLSDELDQEQKTIAVKYLQELVKKRARVSVLKSAKRVDGRGLAEIRPLSCEVGLLACAHGSALFNRGTTQALSVVTLGSPGDEQLLDEMRQEGKKRYMHHYNFPPFSVGEVSPLRGPGRREIGHGALAERALEPVLPKKEDFPYTIRVVSEVLSSNGSSSMASTCGSSLALMDAGVPITKPVAGIAMGVITDKNDKCAILTDIQGIEDHDGDMDFKVAGTKDGVTALQMDVKVDGLNADILKQALDQARDARLKILDTMKLVLDKPREKLSPFAPKIITIRINPEKIGALIGPGGKVINGIIDKTGVTIDVEDNGLVAITGKNGDNLEEALRLVEAITREAKLGEIYDAEIKRVENFGAFAEIFSGQSGLIRSSSFGGARGQQRGYGFAKPNPGGQLKVGDKIKVRVKEIDDLGRINLEVIR